MAMVAATGAEACNTDPLISSAAVAGASVSAQNLDYKMVRLVDNDDNF